MWEFDSTVIQVIQRTPNVKSFRFATDGRQTAYQAGQFFFVTIKVLGEDALHHFTLSSSPTETGYVEFTKRITSSDYSQRLNEMVPGDWAHLKGAQGDFVLDPNARRLAFLTGGIGITPVRSILTYLTGRNLDYDVVLLYGNRSQEEIVFRQELDDMAGRASIRLEHVLSGGQVPPGPRMHGGLIDKAMVSRLIPDYAGRLFYVSGPPSMVASLVEQLRDLNVAGAQVKKDTFLGYE